MAAENGHGAFATPPTEQTAAHAALFRHDVPPLAEVEHELERWASRERLRHALLGRVHHGGAAWDYVAGRLLLALGAEPGWAERLLVAAAEREPSNGWFRLYAIAALLRSGRFTQARALASGPFYGFCEDQLAAVTWIVGLESLRGYPQVSRGLRALLGPVLGHRLPGNISVLSAAKDACDPAFEETRLALDSLRHALTEPLDEARLQGGARAVVAVASRVISREAACAMITAWLAIWSDSGRVEVHAGERLAAALAADPELGPELRFLPPPSRPDRGLWGRSASAFSRSDLVSGLKIGAFSFEEEPDARLWLEALGDPAERRPGAVAPRLLARLRRAALRLRT